MLLVVDSGEWIQYFFQQANSQLYLLRIRKSSTLGYKVYGNSKLGVLFTKLLIICMLSVISD